METKDPKNKTRFQTTNVNVKCVFWAGKTMSALHYLLLLCPCVHVVVGYNMHTQNWILFDLLSKTFVELLSTIIDQSIK